MLFNRRLGRLVSEPPNRLFPHVYEPSSAAEQHAKYPDLESLMHARRQQAQSVRSSANLAVSDVKGMSRIIPETRRSLHHSAGWGSFSKAVEKVNVTLSNPDLDITSVGTKDVGRTCTPISTPPRKVRFRKAWWRRRSIAWQKPVLDQTDERRGADGRGLVVRSCAGFNAGERMDIEFKK
jgi:hypothetical protein